MSDSVNNLLIMLFGQMAERFCVLVSVSVLEFMCRHLFRMTDEIESEIGPSPLLPPSFHFD